MPKRADFYWLDWLGWLWFGPLADGRFGRLEGVNPETMRYVWTRHKLQTEFRLSPITDAQARAVLALYKADAWERGRG